MRSAPVTPPPAPCVSTSRKAGSPVSSTSAWAGPAAVLISIRSRLRLAEGLTVTDANSNWWTDQPFLRGVQYATDRNLAARQSIYSYQEPRIDLPLAVLDALDLTGAETIADVGCGNGIYLAELGRRGHRGGQLGVDASPGMLTAARAKSPAAGFAVGDAVALPLRDGAVDLALAMHMLYHLPEPAG